MELKLKFATILYPVRFFLCLIAIFCLSDSRAQAEEKETLTVTDFINQVKQYHPVSKQAGIIVEKAGASLLAAKGNFDPVFEFNYDDKTFSGTNYYRYTNSELKIPTRTGITLKSGFEKAVGQYTDPELTRGVASYAGIEVPVLKGLLLDKQRASLQQARIYIGQSKQERAAKLNDLVFEAYNAYWQWAAAHQLVAIYAKYIELAKRRNELVRIQFVNGDRARADTIEAYTQLQNYKLLQQEATIALNTKYYELSLFLWNEAAKPYFLSEKYIPDSQAFKQNRPLPDIAAIESQIATNHPLLLIYQSKSQILTVEKRLKYQNLLPAVTVKANILSKEYFDKFTFSNAYLNNNYKLGFSIKTPLFLRQSLGEYREARLKIKEIELQLMQKQWELQNKLRQYHAETNIYRQQLETGQEIRANYQSLLKYEELKFTQGESSLFLVNSRENKLLELDQKLIELQAKYLKAFYSINWSAGILN